MSASSPRRCSTRSAFDSCASSISAVRVGFDLAPEPADDSAGAVLLRTFAVEVKRHRTATPAAVMTWWAQTVRQADAAGLHPLLAYRADRAPWRIVLALDTLIPDTSPADGLPHTATLSLHGFAVIARP